MTLSPHNTMYVDTGCCVGEVMTTKPVCIPKNLSIYSTAHLMREKNVGSVLIKEGHELLGILTEWDFVHRVVAQDLNTQDTPVSQVMVQDIITVSPRMDIFDALRLMRDTKIRHLPVVEDGRLVGFITIKDILKIQPQLLELIDERQGTGLRREREQY